MGSIRLFINKEAFERNKTKYASGFDAVANSDADKGKFYLIDLELMTTPNSFGIKGNAVTMDCATIEQVIQVAASKEQTKTAQNNFYVQMSADITTTDLLKLTAAMIERFAAMQNALATAELEK